MNAAQSARAVSLVVETYTLAEGQSLAALERALRSVCAIAQRRGDCELLLLDADGTAGVRALAAHYPGVRHVLAAGADYDGLKNAGAAHARGQIVVYLDGDCVPMRADWLETLIAPLLAGTAQATCGTTLYEGGSLLKALCTIMDFGFVLESRGGPIGCYPSNNVAFLRSLRVEINVSTGGPLRCACYAHAMTLLRRGTPIHHVPNALVWHEPPGLLGERLRQGYDLVAACWMDPQLRAARWLRHSLWAAPLFYRRAVRDDWRRIRAGHPLLKLTGWRQPVACLLAPLLRLLDLAGIVWALARGPGPRRARVGSPNSTYPSDT